MLLDNYLEPFAERELDDDTEYIEYSAERIRKDGSTERFIGSVAMNAGEGLHANITLATERPLTDADLIAKWPAFAELGLRTDMPMDDELSQQEVEYILDADLTEYGEETLTEQIFDDQIVEYVSRNIKLVRGQEPNVSYQAGYLLPQVDPSEHEETEGGPQLGEGALAETINELTAGLNEPEFNEATRALRELRMDGS